MTAPRVISRAEAGLALPKKFAGWMKLPAPKVFVHHTVTEEYFGVEAAGMREIQQIAFNRGFLDISYSWLIFNSGVIGEGRGWGVVGAHTEGYNSVAHGLAFVGNFQDNGVNTIAIEAAQWLIDEGIRLGKIGTPRTSRPDGGHRDVASTACPGINVYTKIPNLRLPWVPQQEDTDLEYRAIRRVEDGAVALVKKGWFDWVDPNEFSANAAGGLCNNPADDVNAVEWDRIKGYAYKTTPRHS